jgi:hypothetical protein
MSREPDPPQCNREDSPEDVDEKGLLLQFCLSKPELEMLLAQLVEADFDGAAEAGREVPAIRNIAADAIVRDIRAGMEHNQLMEKYDLSFSALCGVAQLLLEGQNLSRSDLAGREQLLECVLDPAATRRCERYYLDFDLPIVELDGRRVEGRVRDLTEKGLGVTGLPAKVGETKTLLISHQKFALLKPFYFEARCRWIRQDDSRDGTFAGFQITKISEENLAQLRKMVKLLTFQLPAQGTVE